MIRSVVFLTMKLVQRYTLIGKILVETKLFILDLVTKPKRNNLSIITADLYRSDPVPSLKKFHLVFQKSFSQVW